MMIEKIPPFVKNFYFLAGMSFFFWLMFFDSNDLITQFQMSRKLTELETEVKYYEEKIQEVKKERTALLSDKEQLERFARETYLMKKKSEDVYVLEEAN